MIDTKTIDQIVNTLRAALPPNLTQDVEKNLRAALLSVFERLELVTREEFEVQSAVLARTRAKLETLEKQVTELEKSLLKK
jgi:ubiquinone biosynthesis accessory factor UbiK